MTFADEMAELAGQRVNIQSEDRPFYFGNVAADGVGADYLVMSGDDGKDLIIPHRAIAWCLFDGENYSLRLLTPLPHRE